MADKQLQPRHIFARNLKALIDESGLSAPEVAKRAGVDRKTVNNQLNARFDPRPELVESVAKVFGVDASLLLSPTFGTSFARSVATKLVQLYNEADEAGREVIMKVAEMAAKHRS